MKEKVAIISILANMLLAGSKITIGLISNSSAVLAEGVHSLADIFSSIVGFFGIKVSQKPVDQKHPYGHYKFEVLSGLVITLILFISGMGIIYETFRKFLNPEEINTDSLVFIVMSLSVLINFFTSKIKIYYGKKENSLTLLADGSHDKADVLASLAVLVGAFLSRYWIYIDPILAILIGLYIIKESFPLGKEAMDSLLDVSAGEYIEEKIRTIAKIQDIEISALKTQKKGSIVTANLEIKLPNNLKVEEAFNVSNNLRGKLMKDIDILRYVTIQIISHEIENGFYKPEFGKSFGWQRKGKFKETIQTAKGKGPEGYCVCSKCGYEIIHTKGLPCSALGCPKCQINLERK